MKAVSRQSLPRSVLAQWLAVFRGRAELIAIRRVMVTASA
jgi:hypothetical protein